MVGEAAVRLEEAAHGVDRSRSSTGGSITPAMPFAASITTRDAEMAPTSTNDRTRSTYAGQMS